MATPAVVRPGPGVRARDRDGPYLPARPQYAEALDLKVLDASGRLTTVIMGSYGVGVSRAVACVAEGNHDEIGLVWPREVAPTDVHLVATGKDEEVFVAAESLAASCPPRVSRSLLDDRRGVSPGVVQDSSSSASRPSSWSAGAWPPGLSSSGPAPAKRREIALTGAVAEIIREIRGWSARRARGSDGHDQSGRSRPGRGGCRHDHPGRRAAGSVR